MSDILKMIEERQKSRTEAEKMIDEIVDRLVRSYFDSEKPKVKLLPKETK